MQRFRKSDSFNSSNTEGEIPILHQDRTEDAEDQRLRLSGIADAQASLLRHLCRLVAESWSDAHSQ